LAPFDDPQVGQAPSRSVVNEAAVKSRYRAIAQDDVVRVVAPDAVHLARIFDGALPSRRCRTASVIRGTGTARSRRAFLMVVESRLTIVGADSAQSSRGVVEGSRRGMISGSASRKARATSARAPLGAAVIEGAMRASGMLSDADEQGRKAHADHRAVDDRSIRWPM
jgi:hypothetical protein